MQTAFILICLQLIFILTFSQEGAVSNHQNHLVQEPATLSQNEMDTLKILENIINRDFEDYTLFDYKKGDLNKDAKEDFVLVLEKKCDDEEEKFLKCRKVVLLINNELPTLKVAAMNDNVVECSFCGGGGVGDPHQGIAIKNGYVSFESFYGGCYKTFQVITFKYNSTKKDWFLHKVGTETYSCRQEDNPGDEINVATEISTIEDFGVVSFKDYPN